mmetsp:Transcript_25682/g.19417  ORF Transcript_25682/g.19417 Transcript_25682/m.19417 type:complete len:121 (-) Transcript_25682:31-393(-)
MVNHPSGKYNVSQEVDLIKGLEGLAYVRTHMEVFVIDISTGKAYYVGDNKTFRMNLPDVKVVGCSFNADLGRLELFVINYMDFGESDAFFQRDSNTQSKLVKLDVKFTPEKEECCSCMIF